MEPILEINNLSVDFDTPQGRLHAVRDVSLTLYKGETLAIIGESGCGKSVLCKSILGLLPRTAHMKADSLLLNGADISRYCERDMRRLRGRALSMTFQDPLAALTPTFPVGEQIAEAVRLRDPGLGRGEVRGRVLALMAQAGIPSPEDRYPLYPHQLSGGLRQRCLLAIALAARPLVLLADEPTTALDVTVAARILDLLHTLPKEHGTACVLVSHDLGAAARAADRIAVMYAGKLLETGTAEEILTDPRHPYTWGLLRSLPGLAERGKPLYAIPGLPPSPLDPPPGDPFACRNEFALKIDYEEPPPLFRVSETHTAASWLLDPRAPKVTPPFRGTAAPPPSPLPARKQEGEALLEVEHLSRTFHPRRNTVIPALRDVSFRIYPGEIFGLVGESGSGKTTAARCIMNLCRPSAGRVLYRGVDTGDPRAFRRNRRMLQSARQLIFQDAASSLDGKMTVADLVTEPMRIHRREPPRGSFWEEAAFRLREVGLDERCLDCYPAALSGGQRQRVAIARALSMEPELLVADEPTASLDVSVQAQILNVLQRLQAAHGFGILLIAHDLSVVRYLCDRVGVLYEGRLVECAPTETLFTTPRHPYTQALLASLPALPERRGNRKAGKEGLCG